MWAEHILIHQHVQYTPKDMRNLAPEAGTSGMDEKFYPTVLCGMQWFIPAWVRYLLMEPNSSYAPGFVALLLFPRCE